MIFVILKVLVNLYCLYSFGFIKGTIAFASYIFFIRNILPLFMNLKPLSCMEEYMLIDNNGKTTII